jgi:hypothetical protein
MSEFDSLYKQLMLEMARPATFLAFDQNLNNAYSECLQIMRQYGETNAPTFAIWDYIWRCLPSEVRDVYGEERKKHSAPTLKHFMADILKNKLNPQIRIQLVKDLTDESKIRSYVNRPLNDRGNRAKGNAIQSGLSPWSLDDVSSI